MATIQSATIEKTLIRSTPLSVRFPLVALCYNTRKKPRWPIACRQVGVNIFSHLVRWGQPCPTLPDQEPGQGRVLGRAGLAALPFCSLRPPWPQRTEGQWQMGRAKLLSFLRSVVGPDHITTRALTAPRGRLVYAKADHCTSKPPVS